MQYYGVPYYPQPREMMQPQMQPQMMQPMQQQNSVQWVSSEQEARNYLVAPNSAVALWDSSAPRVYLKKADASGKPMFTGYDLVERTETPSPALQNSGVSYVTREEFDALAASVRKLTDKKKREEENSNE